MLSMVVKTECGSAGVCTFWHCKVMKKQSNVLVYGYCKIESCPTFKMLAGTQCLVRIGCGSCCAVFVPRVKLGCNVAETAGKEKFSDLELTRARK